METKGFGKHGGGKVVRRKIGQWKSWSWSRIWSQHHRGSQPFILLIEIKNIDSDLQFFYIKLVKFLRFPFFVNGGGLRGRGGAEVRSARSARSAEDAEGAARECRVVASRSQSFGGLWQMAFVSKTAGRRTWRKTKLAIRASGCIVLTSP